MKKKPRKKWSKILDKEMLISILLIAVYVTIWCLTFFMLNRSNIDLARTWTFVLLVVLEMFAVFVVRADYGVKFLSNWWLFAFVCHNFLYIIIIISQNYSSGLYILLPSKVQTFSENVPGFVRLKACSMSNIFASRMSR